MDGTLTPRAIGNIFDAAPPVSESDGWYRVANPVISIQAASPESPASWIEFEELDALEVTLADLEAFYGTKHRSPPPAKEYLSVTFELEPGKLPVDVYVAARLRAGRALPDSRVSYLQLRYPR